LFAGVASSEFNIEADAIVREVRLLRTVIILDEEHDTVLR